MKSVTRIEKRREERYALYVVPVIMRDQHLSFDSAVATGAHPPVAEHSQARATIENEPRVVGGREFKAGSVAAVAPSVALQRWRRAAHSPEDQLRSRVHHFRARLPRR